MRQLIARFARALAIEVQKAAADHVAALERKGYVIRERGQARGIKLTSKSSGVPLLRADFRGVSERLAVRVRGPPANRSNGIWHSRPLESICSPSSRRLHDWAPDPRW